MSRKYVLISNHYSCCCGCLTFAPRIGVTLLIAFCILLYVSFPPAVLYFYLPPLVPSLLLSLGLILTVGTSLAFTQIDPGILPKACQLPQDHPLRISENESRGFYSSDPVDRNIEETTNAPEILNTNPPNTHPSDSTSEDPPIQSEIPSYDLSDAERGFFGLKPCKVCGIFRPEGSKHCYICGVCVDGFDHHCHYVNQCIGQRNRLFFVIALLTGGLNGFVNCGFSIPVFVRKVMEQKFWPALGKNILLFLSIFGSFLLALFVTSFGLDQWQFACKGQTFAGQELKLKPKGFSCSRLFKIPKSTVSYHPRPKKAKLWYGQPFKVDQNGDPFDFKSRRDQAQDT